VREALSNYGSGASSDLAQAETAYANHVQLLKDTRKQFTTDRKTQLQKELDDAESAYRDGELSYQNYSEKRKQLESVAQSDIHKIRMDWTSKIAEATAAETEIIKNKKVARIAAIQEQMQAELMTRKDGMAAIAEAEETAEIQLKASKLKVEQVYITERRNLLKESADTYLNNLKSETASMKSEHETRISVLAIAEAKGTITVKEAASQRLQAETQYYLDMAQKATDGMEQVKQVYGIDSDEFKRAIEAKKQALDGLLRKEKSIANSIKSLNKKVLDSKASAEEKIRDLKRKSLSGLALYKDKELEVMQLLSKAAQLSNTDTAASIETYKKAMTAAADLSGEVVEGERVIKSEGETTQTAINLINRAQSGIEKAAQSRRTELVASQKEIASAAKTTGDALDSDKEALARLLDEINSLEPIDLDANGEKALQEIKIVNDNLTSIESRTVNIDADTSAVTAKISEIRMQLQQLAKQTSKSTHTVEFKGKASPEKGLSDTIKDVNNLMAEMQEIAGKGSVSLTTFLGDSGDGTVNLTAATQGVIKKYSDLQTEFKNKKLVGEITFGDEQNNFKQNADMVQQTFGALYDDLKNGVQEYSVDFQSVMQGINDDTSRTKQSFKNFADESDFSFANLAENSKAYGQQMRQALEAGSVENYDNMLANLQKYSDGFNTQMQAQIDSASKMADEVIADGDRMIQQLSQNIQKYGQQIASLESEIAGMGDSTSEKIRQLNQNFMTDHQKWLDDKKAADQLYYQAQAEMASGNWAKSKELMLASQNLAGTLAREIKDENGNIIMSLEQTTKTAISMTQQAGDGATEALRGQKKELEEQQQAARDQLLQTQEMVASVKDMAANMKTMTSELLAGFNDSMQVMFENLGDSIKDSIVEAMGVVKDSVESPMTPSIDDDPIRQQYKALADEQAKTVVAMAERYNTLAGEANSISQRLSQGALDKLQEAQAEFKRLRNLAGDDYKTTVSFLGKASPVKSLTETFNSVQGLFAKFAETASRKYNTVVEMTGTGSATMPLSEKLAEMTTKITDFGAIANNTIENSIDFSGLGKGLASGMQQAGEIGRVSMGGLETPVNVPEQDFFSGLKKAELNISGSKVEVVSTENNITGLEKILRREGMLAV